MIEWKDIKGFEGYQASNTGDIRSVKRTIANKDGFLCTYSGRILKSSITKKGYKKVYPTIHCKKYSKAVHRLVAIAFIENPMNYPQINHIDCDKLNNNTENLEWCNNSQNQKHAFKNGMQSNLGSKCPTAKINESIASDIKKMIKDRVYNLAEISRILAVSYHIVKDISRGRTWTHV